MIKDTDKVTLTVWQLKKLVKESKQPGFIYDENDLAYALMKNLDYNVIQMIANSMETGDLDVVISDPNSYKIFAEKLSEEVHSYMRHQNI